MIGIKKEYKKRVGEGKLKKEINEEIGELIGKKGNELGVVKGRKRSWGWLDEVIVRKKVRN